MFETLIEDISKLVGGDCPFESDEDLMGVSVRLMMLTHERVLIDTIVGQIKTMLAKQDPQMTIRFNTIAQPMQVTLTELEMGGWKLQTPVGFVTSV